MKNSRARVDPLFPLGSHINPYISWDVSNFKDLRSLLTLKEELRDPGGYPGVFWGEFFPGRSSIYSRFLAIPTRPKREGDFSLRVPEAILFLGSPRRWRIPIEAERLKKMVRNQESTKTIQGTQY